MWISGTLTLSILTKFGTREGEGSEFLGKAEGLGVFVTSLSLEDVVVALGETSTKEDLELEVELFLLLDMYHLEPFVPLSLTWMEVPRLVTQRRTPYLSFFSSDYYSMHHPQNTTYTGHTTTLLQDLIKDRS